MEIRALDIDWGKKVLFGNKNLGRCNKLSQIGS